jgi:hypothetical protein
MGYGLVIKNAAGRTVIDTDKGESLLYAGNPYTASAGTTYPKPSWGGSNLILARPSTAGYSGKTVSRYSWGGNWALAQTGAAPTVTWRELRAQSEDNISPSGYGLLLYGPGGQNPGNVILSATDLDATAILVAEGQFDGSYGGGGNAGYYTEVPMDPNLKRGSYYALVTNTQSQYAPGVGGQTPYQLHIDYRFDYVNSLIRVQNYLVTNPDTPAAISTREARSYDWAIFYVRNGGATDFN